MNKKETLRKIFMRCYPTQKQCLVIVSLCAFLLSSSGCQEPATPQETLELYPIYGHAIGGAIVGWIIGHQSDEDEAGAALGAGILAMGELFRQMDNINRYHSYTPEDIEQAAETIRENGEPITVRISNSNGSTTTVELRLKDEMYIGPKGEQYDILPTEEQLKPVYGF